MIRYMKGNLLESKAEALVNAVNCVGVMGAGIAKQFKEAYPEVFREYREKCRRGELRPGNVWAMRSGDKWIVHAATKGHWRARSYLGDVAWVLSHLRNFLQMAEVKSMALPALGCGNGGLQWPVVKTLIANEFLGVDADVEVYEPQAPIKKGAADG